MYFTDKDKIYSIRYYSYLINKEKEAQYLIFDMEENTLWIAW